MLKIHPKALALCVCAASFGFASASEVAFNPGTYEGVANGRNGPIKVEVTVGNHKISAVKVITHKESAGLSDAPMEKIPNEIISNQSLKVDNISGATFSSQGLINACKDALCKASKDISPLLVAPAVAKNSQKPKDEKVDVVVIGSGIAGLTSAIAAHEGGAKVLVLEKQGMLGAGDSMNISTGITAGGTKLIKEKGIQGKTTQDYVDLLMKQAKDKTFLLIRKMLKLTPGEVEKLSTG